MAAEPSGTEAGRSAWLAAAGGSGHAVYTGHSPGPQSVFLHAWTRLNLAGCCPLNAGGLVVHGEESSSPGELTQPPGGLRVQGWGGGKPYHPFILECSGAWDPDVKLAGLRGEGNLGACPVLCQCCHWTIAGRCGWPWGSPGDSAVKESTCRAAMKEMGIRSLGLEDPLEEGMATCFSILACGAWRAIVRGVAESQTRLNAHVDDPFLILFQPRGSGLYYRMGKAARFLSCISQSSSQPLLPFTQSSRRPRTRLHWPRFLACLYGPSDITCL